MEAVSGFSEAAVGTAQGLRQQVSEALYFSQHGPDLAPVPPKRTPSGGSFESFWPLGVFEVLVVASYPTEI